MLSINSYIIYNICLQKKNKQDEKQVVQNRNECYMFVEIRGVAKCKLEGLFGLKKNENYSFVAIIN